MKYDPKDCDWKTWVRIWLGDNRPELLKRHDIGEEKLKSLDKR